MEILIYFWVVPAFFALCKFVKIFFNKLVERKAYELVNKYRQNGHSNGKETKKGKG